MEENNLFVTFLEVFVKKIIFFCFFNQKSCYLCTLKIFINKLKVKDMTKAEIVAQIAEKTGLEKSSTQAVVEAFMDIVKKSVAEGEPVYLRGFGSFIRKTRAEKVGRNIKLDQSIVIPAHNIPAFKPSKTFANEVK